MIRTYVRMHVYIYTSAIHKVSLEAEGHPPPPFLVLFLSLSLSLSVYIYPYCLSHVTNESINQSINQPIPKKERIQEKDKHTQKSPPFPTKNEPSSHLSFLMVFYTEK